MVKGRQFQIYSYPSDFPPPWPLAGHGPPVIVVDIISIFLCSRRTEGRLQTDGDFREGGMVEALLLGGGGGGAGDQEGDQLLVDQEDGQGGAEKLDEGGGAQVPPYRQPGHRIQSHPNANIFVKFYSFSNWLVFSLVSSYTAELSSNICVLTLRTGKVCPRNVLGSDIWQSEACDHLELADWLTCPT